MEPEKLSQRFEECPRCGNSDLSDIAEYCTTCGTSLFNYCSDSECKHSNPPYAYYCEKCGTQTIYLLDTLIDLQIDEQTFVTNAIANLKSG